VYPHDGSTYETILADADHRMYRDKTARRGQLATPRATPPAEFLAPDVFEPTPIPARPRPRALP
jgi:hypothetical protein